MSSYPRHLRTTPNVYQSFYLNVDWLVVLNIFQMFAYMTQFSTDPQSPPQPYPTLPPTPTGRWCSILGARDALEASLDKGLNHGYTRHR